jgi:hypothetical protein
MTARHRKMAALAFVGGAALALLGGCAQAPATYRTMPLESSAAAMRAYLNAEALAAQQYERNFHATPPQYVPLAPPPQSRTPAPSHATQAAIPETPPQQPAKSAAPRDPDCVGYWRLCWFLGS